jgi:hypothetical protein
MTDIRRHGFESDAQWREHLEEIEDMEARSAENRARRDLAALRADLAALRGRLRARARRGRAMPLWQRIAGAAALLLLFTLASR